MVTFLSSLKLALRMLVRDWRAARSMIGLVPQELTTNAFETVWASVVFSRGLFGFIILRILTGAGHSAWLYVVNTPRNSSRPKG